MIRVVLALALLLIATPAEAKKSRHNKVVLPTKTLTCNKTCKARIRTMKACQNLEHTMDRVELGHLVVCGYTDEKAVWVRPSKESGECYRVSIPANRMKVCKKS